MSKLKRRFYLVAARWFLMLAGRSLKRWRPRVIMVTGSVGKTTMLNLLAAQKLPAHFSHNANSAFGIAFDILGLDGVRGSRLRWLYLFFACLIRAFTFRYREKFYVVETDVERPREAALVAKKLQPEVVLTTPIGLSHAVYFEDLVTSGKYQHELEAIRAEFLRVSEQATRLALSAEDKDLGKITSYRVSYDQTVFRTVQGEFHFAQPMPEEVGVQLLLCERLMQYLARPVIYDLAEFVLPPGRNNYFAGVRGVKLIDSSYNAHLISMQSVLGMVKKIRWNRKWLVISDMIQQGKAERAEHEKLAEAILAVGAERVLLVGSRSGKYIYPKLRAAGQSVERFASVREALPYLEANLTGTELVLFKGSQYLEWLVEKLLANPADAAGLARREKAAVRRRVKRGLR